MSGIAAIVNFKRNIENERNRLESMMKDISERLNIKCSYLYDEHILMAHLNYQETSTNDIQLMSVVYNNCTYSVVFNGSLYNCEELREELETLGFTFKTNCESEVVLMAYIAFKEKCLDKFDGVFSFVLKHDHEIFAARDPYGVKPLFYMFKSDGECLIASKIESILKEGSIVPTLTKEGFIALISIGPMQELNKTLYKNIYALEAGSYLFINGNYHECIKYYHLCAKSNDDTYNNSVKKVRELLDSALLKQSVSGNVCSMLSGGLDSSIVSIKLNEYLKGIDTYSLEFKDNDKYFATNPFQPTQDPDFVKIITHVENINHSIKIIDNQTLVNYLKKALYAKDMPHMSDIDASMLWFCYEVKKEHSVVLTGECADEVFGGYPWFYKEELYQKDTFPWLNYLNEKINLVNSKFKHFDFYGYRKNVYDRACNDISYLDSDDLTMKINRKMTNLSIYYFMQTLLARMDGMSSYVGLEARVPFADKQVLEYLYNVPVAYKFAHNQEKGLLRDAYADSLPTEVLNRKKNPFPKTYDPAYVEAICDLLSNEIENNLKLIYLFDKEQLTLLVKSKGESFQFPWFGQLMKGPQLIAYLYQLSIWLKEYNIKIDF